MAATNGNIKFSILLQILVYVFPSSPGYCLARMLRALPAGRPSRLGPCVTVTVTVYGAIRQNTEYTTNGNRVSKKHKYSIIYFILLLHVFNTFQPE